MKALPCEVSTYAKSLVKDIGVSDPMPTQSPPTSWSWVLTVAALETFPSPCLRPSQTRSLPFSPRSNHTCGCEEAVNLDGVTAVRKRSDLPQSGWAALCVVPPRGQFGSYQPSLALSPSMSRLFQFPPSHHHPPQPPPAHFPNSLGCTRLQVDR